LPADFLLEALAAPDFLPPDLALRPLPAREAADFERRALDVFTLAPVDFLAAVFAPVDFPRVVFALVLLLPLALPRDGAPFEAADFPPEGFLLADDLLAADDLLFALEDPDLDPPAPDGRADPILGPLAAFPAIAPITPPTTAPTGPAILPRTAPVAAPAACFEIGGIEISPDD
jgi:hypothetical protein